MNDNTTNKSQISKSSKISATSSFTENERSATASNNIETIETVKMVGGKIVKVPGTRPIPDNPSSGRPDLDFSNNSIESSATSQQVTSSSTTVQRSSMGGKENPYVKYDERPVKPAKNLNEILAAESSVTSSVTSVTEGQTVKMVGGKLIKHGKMKSPTRKVQKSENVQDILTDSSNSRIVKSGIDFGNEKHITSMTSATESTSSSFRTEKTFIKESAIEETILTSDGKVISSSTTKTRGEPSRNVRMISGKIISNEDTNLQTISSDQSIINEKYAQDISNLQSDMRGITGQLNASPTSKRSTKSRSSVSPDKKSPSKSPDRFTSSSERSTKSRIDRSSNIDQTYLSMDTTASSYHEPVCTCPPEEHVVSDFTDNVMSRTFIMDERVGLFDRDDKTSRGVTNMRDETDLTRQIISNTSSSVYDVKSMKSFKDDKTAINQDVIDRSNRTLVRQDTFDKSDDTSNIRDLTSFSDVRTSRDSKSTTLNSVSENTTITSTTNVRMIGGKIVKENVTVTRKSSPSPDRRGPIKKSERSPTPTRRTDKSPTPTRRTDKSPTPTTRTDKSPIKKVERSPSRERSQPKSGKSPDKSPLPSGPGPQTEIVERGIRMVGGKIIKSEQYVTSEQKSNQFSEQNIIQQNVTIQSNVNVVHSSSSQDIKVLDLTDVKNIRDQRIVKDDRKSITSQDHRQDISVNESIKESTTTIDKKSTEKTTKKTKDKKKTEKSETIIKEQCICEICTCGRHRCPHKAGQDGPPLEWTPHETPKTSLTQDEFHPIPLDKVERPKIQRLHTQLDLPTGEIDDTTAYKEDYPPKKAEKGPRYRFEDNLKPEGGFERPHSETFTPAERPTIIKPKDNLKLEGDFEKRPTEKYGPGERAPIVKHADNLKPEGEFDRPKAGKFVPAERPTAKKPQDNLKPEGDFERPKPVPHEKGDRPKAIKPRDNLKPEGDFERPIKETVGQGERAPIIKHPDNLKLEGDFEDKPRPKAPERGERAPVKKPKDNLYPEGDFERPEYPEFQKADRPVAYKPHDNLKPEGEFERPIREKPKQAERVQPFKTKDNLKPEGDFEGRPKDDYGPKIGDRAPVKKPKDNLYPEGDFERPEYPDFQTAERQKAFKPHDNLKPEGDFERPQKEGYGPGERAAIVKHPDNLKPEGEFERRKPEQYGPGERLKPIRHPDNLKMEGDFVNVTYRNDYSATKGERTEIVKHHDNLIVEGKFEGISRFKEDFKPGQGDRSIIKRPKDNLTLSEGKIEAHTTSKDSFKIQKQERDESLINKKRHIQSQITLGTEKSSFGTYSKKTASSVSKQIQENYGTSMSSSQHQVEERNVVHQRAVAKPTMTMQTNGHLETSEREQSCRQQVERREQQQMISRSEQKLSKSSSNSMSNIKQSVEQETRLHQQARRSQQPCEIHGRRNQYLQSEDQRVIQQRTVIENQEHNAKITDVKHSGRKTWEKRDYETERRNYDINQENKLMKINENLREQNIMRSGGSVIRDSVFSNQINQSNQTNISGHRAIQSNENILRSSTASNIIQNQTALNYGNTLSERSSDSKSYNSLSSSNSRSTLSSANMESRAYSSETKNVRSSHAASSEFQKTIRQEGFKDTELQSQLQTAGHHRKNIISSSSSDVSNAVLHRKGIVSATESEHTLSSTAAIQRQSLKNLDGQFMTTSQDRKSLSSLHRQGIDEHISNIRKSDSLTVGGKFYGQSEASRSYGNFSSQQTVTRTRQSNTSNISLGSEMSRQEIASLYKKEYTPRVSGPCPAATIDKSQNVFKHTRDTKTHKFYLPNVSSGKPAQR
uniref:Titin n=1 Tax=Cacopsylla melanoneura TaxID=428564 RepID=A0A8D8XTT4_9HEMI